MDPRRDLPPALRPPAGGELAHITWRADLGSRARVGDLARHLEDLDTAIHLGERWGTELARAAAYQQLVNRVIREGPRALEEAADRLGFRAGDLADLDEWIHWGPRRPRPFPYSYRDPSTLLQAIADMQLPEHLGRQLEVDHAAYRNPLEVVLGGSGLLLAGVISVLRLVRDWSNTRRRGRADAQQAEASAREQHARADECEARAELVRWLVNEAKAGRLPIPVGELLEVVAQSEEVALERLASGNVELQLPSGLDPASS